MYCRKCGFKNDEGVKFCMKCGSPMEASSDVASAEAPAADSVAQPTAAAAPVVAAATVMPNSQTAPVSEATRFEMPAFVLSIIAIALLIFPIPVLSWFSLPCGILGFMFAFYGWIKCREQKGELSIKTICAAFLAAYVLLNALTLNMGGGTDIVGSLGSLLGGVVGSIH